MPPLKALLVKHALLTKEIHALSARIQKALPAELAALPARYGFSSFRSFKAALLAAQSSKKVRKAKVSPKVRITYSMKAEYVKKYYNRKTGAEIAWKLDTTLKEVHQIMRNLGLLPVKDASSDPANTPQ
jgi:hypothetical protein